MSLQDARAALDQLGALPDDASPAGQLEFRVLRAILDHLEAREAAAQALTDDGKLYLTYNPSAPEETPSWFMDAWKARKNDLPTVLPPADVYPGEQVRRILRAVFGMMWGAEVSDYGLGWFDKRLRDKGLSPADRDLVRSILQGDPE